MATCAHCGTQNRDDLKYCKNCGEQLSSAAIIVCHKCGARNPTASLYCNRCGERMAATVTPAGTEKAIGKQSQVAHKTPPAAKIAGKAASSERAATLPQSSSAIGPQPAQAPETLSAETAGGDHDIPDWLSRFYVSSAGRAQLIPTHELLRMANALGIDVDYSTLRFWQKRGLVHKPVRGPVSSGRGTRGYYDPSLMDRLSFIREIQKNYAMGLESIRDELGRIDKKLDQGGSVSPATLYQERLSELHVRRDTESKKTLVAMLAKALGIVPEEIATVVIRKKDGETVRLLTDKVLAEQAERK